MLVYLIRKEILDHLLSLRFLILSAVGALIIWLSLFSGYTYYQARVKDYRFAQAMTEERLRQFADVGKVNLDPWMEVSAISYKVQKPPTAMSIFVRGLEPNLGRSVLVSSPENPRLRSSPAVTEPILGVFPPLDLGLVVQVVLSLFVLLLTYDAICGEKEGGTLRLLASFSVPRDRMLMGKLLGALIPTGVVFGLPLILGIAVVLAVSDVGLTGPELARLGWILVAFALYLTAFICAGLFASCLVRQAATSFVLLLAFWTLSVVIVPRLSLIAADGLRPGPSVHEYQAELSRINMENLDKRRALRAQWQKEHSQPGQEYWRTPEGREAFWLYFTRSRQMAEDLTRPLRLRVEESFRNRYNARLDLAVLLSRLSPTFALKNAAVRMAGTGLDRQRRFEESFWQHKGRNEAWYSRASERNRLQQSNPKKYGKPEWDISDMPRFTYRDLWPGEDTQTALMDIGMLALWGLIFFLGAYVTMLRYDLR